MRICITRLGWVSVKHEKLLGLHCGVTESRELVAGTYKVSNVTADRIGDHLPSSDGNKG